jgi:Domain of unknown function (DUF4382)
MTYRASAAVLIIATGGLLALLGGCSGSTEVSLTGNNPAQYSHIYVTIQGVEFNQSSTAGPDDGGWSQFTFSTPTTVDLVAANSNNLSSLISSLKVLPGTYSQVRLMPVDATSTLQTSASNLGALFNFEADYVDAAGTTHQLPLELLNPDKGIGIPTGLKVPIGNVGSALSQGLSGVGGGSTSGTTVPEDVSGTSPTTGTIGSTTGTTGTTTGSTGVGIGVGSGSSSSPANQFAVFSDGGTDLLPFTYSGTAGVMFNQHASAYDLSKSGGISGQLTLTNITTGVSGLPAIEVNAEVLSADGTRHVIVNTTSVSSDGSFLLYPLSASTDGDWYDVVIHGPGIATIIIQNVEVTLPSSSSSLSSLQSSTTTSTTTTTTSSTSTTGTGSTTANNVVAIGTLTPRSATSYTANLASSPLANLPAGTVIDFDQTLGTKNAVPYVIEENAVDPFNQVLFNAQTLSVGTVDSGTWSSTGAPVTVVSAAPLQGAGTYIVTPTVPFYAEGALTSTVSAPASSTTTTTTTTTTTAPPQTFTVPAPTLPSGTGSGTLTASVAQVTAGKYDQGELMVSNNGTLVAVASLASVFAQEGGGTVTVSGLPSGTASSVFYVTVRAWNSSNPAAAPEGSMEREWYDTPIDLRGSTTGSIKLTVN